MQVIFRACVRVQVETSTSVFTEAKNFQEKLMANVSSYLVQFLFQWEKL